MLKGKRFKIELRLYGRNQSGCEKAKMWNFYPLLFGFSQPFTHFFALMKISMCFKQLEASHIMSWDS